MKKQKMSVIEKVAEERAQDAAFYLKQMQKSQAEAQELKKLAKLTDGALTR